MPIDVPKTPKVLTTKYQNWRGVDYTNDPSNVWYRRSPNGLNMLPNLDGQPFKRNGWKVEFTPEDFCDAASISPAVDVEQYKVDYFELGGIDYLFFHTSVGCFYYVDELTFIDRSYEKEEANYYSKTQLYDVGDYCEYTVNYLLKRYKCTTAITVPEPFNSSKWTEVNKEDCWKSFPPTGVDIDYRKAFFFEGGGRAAYYLFAGDKMYWFDGTLLNEAHPTVPTVLEMCDPSGAGDVLYDANMLTKWRAVEYECDGTSTAYTVPGGFETQIIGDTEYPVGIYNVYLTDANGNWVVTYDWTATNGVVTFINGVVPQETIKAQNNLKIIYRTSGLELSEQVSSTSPSSAVTALHIVTKRLLVKKTGINGEWETIPGEQEETTQDYYDASGSTSVSLDNLAERNSVHTFINVANRTDPPNWIQLSQYLLTSLNSYGTKLSIVLYKKDNSLKSTERRKAAAQYMFENYPDCYGTSVHKSVYYEDIPSNFSEGIAAAIMSGTYYAYKVTVTQTHKKYLVRCEYVQNKYLESPNRNAFFSAGKSLVYGNGIINQVFITAAAEPKFNTRVWYSMATDPVYFPDTNYIEVGATDKKIMGLIKVGDYLGIIKQGSATDTSVYLAYATSFEDITTYAVKQSVNGIGAASNGSFNILNGEPLFLSEEGVMGIEPAQDEERKIRNRSYYVNKKLEEEGNLSNAFSFVYKGMYWLGINNHVYVLDGAQKSSWENEKTNLQYECYYLDNIPAKCFAKKDGRLWFIDTSGNVCRFKGDGEELKYVDEYTVRADDNDTWYSDVAPQTVDGELVFNKDDIYYIGEVRGSYSITPSTQTSAQILADLYENGFSTNIGKSISQNDIAVRLRGLYGDSITPSVLRTPEYTTSTEDDDVYLEIASGDSAFDPPPAPISPTSQVDVDRCYAVEIIWATHNKLPISWVTMETKTVFYNGTTYSISDIGETTVTVLKGAPIKAVWGTIADDDGSAHYYKSLQKKGSVVALMPMSNNGVKVYVIPDEKDRIFVGETTAGNHVLPFNYYLRKKIKKYKRLQIVCENDTYDCGFGVDEIIKSYTLGSYAKR